MVLKTLVLIHPYHKSFGIGVKASIPLGGSLQAWNALFLSGGSRPHNQHVNPVTLVSGETAWTLQPEGTISCDGQGPKLCGREIPGSERIFWAVAAHNQAINGLSKVASSGICYPYPSGYEFYADANNGTLIWGYFWDLWVTTHASIWSSMLPSQGWGSRAFWFRQSAFVTSVHWHYVRPPSLNRNILKIKENEIR